MTERPESVWREIQEKEIAELRQRLDDLTTSMTGVLQIHHSKIEKLSPGLPKTPKEFKRQAWKRLRHLAEAFSPFWREEQ